MVNYIKHMNAALSRLGDDERCNAAHISLYAGLFYCWNQAFFRNPISVSRGELMLLSRIGSTKTYYKCLNDLHEWEYIRYMPSTNFLVGSKITMIRFDKTGRAKKSGKHTKADDTIRNTKKKTKTARGSTRNQPVTRKGSAVTSRRTSKGSTGTQRVPPSINSKNNTNLINLKNTKNAYEQADANSGLLNGKSRNTGNTKGNRKTGKRADQSDRSDRPQNLDEVVVYFEEKKSTGAEAEKFHNYFESVGWRVGGRATMKNWRAAARNWIANIPNYNNQQHGKTKAFKPQLTGKKNYAERY